MMSSGSCGKKKVLQGENALNYVISSLRSTVHLELICIVSTCGEKLQSAISVLFATVEPKVA